MKSLEYGDHQPPARNIAWSRRSRRASREIAKSSPELSAIREPKDVRALIQGDGCTSLPRVATTSGHDRTTQVVRRDADLQFVNSTRHNSAPLDWRHEYGKAPRRTPLRAPRAQPTPRYGSNRRPSTWPSHSAPLVRWCACLLPTGFRTPRSRNPVHSGSLLRAPRPRNRPVAGVGYSRSRNRKGQEWRLELAPGRPG